MGTQSATARQGGRPFPATLALLGVGRAGRDVAHLLKRAGLPIVLLWNRSEVPPVDGQTVEHGPLPSLIDAEMVILATADRALPELARSLRGRLARQATVVHLSGVLPGDVVRGTGQPCGSMHPLQTLVGNGQPSVPFPWILEGDPEAVDACRQLCRAMGCPANVLPREDKARYHMAACSASNLLIALVDLCERHLAATGIPADELPGLFLPLMSATLDNIARRGTGPSLTGPVVRGDLETVRAHLLLLDESPDDQDAYRSLSRLLVEVSRGQGLDPAGARELEALLTGGCPPIDRD